MLTRQEIFDKVAKHLLTQNAKAIDLYGDYDYPSCRYRSKGGLKCAAGCLIPDELYDPNLEGQGVFDGKAVDKILIKAGVPEEQLQFVLELQHLHDSYSPEEWPELLNNLAGKYKLNLIPELKADA